ncbi:MAG: diguanylate cyclase [Pseudomonadota bacterium]
MDKDSENKLIISSIELFDSKAETLTLDHVLAKQSQFLPVENVQWEGLVNAWIRFKIKNLTPRASSWFLTLNITPTEFALDLDTISFYAINQQDRGLLGKAGYSVPFNHHAVAYRYPTVNILLPPNSEEWIYVQFTWLLQDVTDFSSAFTIRSTSNFNFEVTQEYLILNLLIGSMVALGLYNLMLFFSIRDSAYLYYVAYVSAACIALLFYTNLAPQYLYPNAAFSPFSTGPTRIYIPFLYLMVITAIYFAQAFLQLHHYAPKLYSLLRSLNTLLMVAFIASIFLSITTSSLLTTNIAVRIAEIVIEDYIINYAMVGFVFLPIIGSLVWWRGFTPARFYVIAWALPTITIAIAAAQDIFTFQLMDASFMDTALFFSITLEEILLSFALADRINMMRLEKTQMQAELLATQTQLNERLEEQVAARTQELKQANEALVKLSNEDGLTQLFNRRYFNNALEQEWNRLQRENIPLSLIMCDVDHFKKYNDTYGHQSGDHCLQQVANVIRSKARRPTDTPARYGGEEFAIILPQTTTEGAQELAESIRKGVEQLAIPHENSTTKDIVSVSFGVASVIPDRTGDTAQLIAMADEALYQSKAAGRDQVSVQILHP